MNSNISFNGRKHGLTDDQLEMHAGELEVISEATGRRGERRRLVRWGDSLVGQAAGEDRALEV